MKRIKFKPLDVGETVPSPLDHLTVDLHYEPQQPASLGAITFTLAIKNKSKQSLTLHNPYDLVTYILTNAEGWPINLPAPASRLKINRQGPFVNRKGNYLKVSGVTVDQAQQDIDVEVAKEVIIVGAGSTYAYELQIDKIAAPQGQDSPQNITSGKYGLAFILPLILPATDPQFSRTLGSDTIIINVS